MEALELPKCPECGNSKVYCNGNRYRKDGSVSQRFVCPRCGASYTQKYIRYIGQYRDSHYALERGESEKMDNVTETKTVTVDQKDFNGKKAQYIYKLEIDNYAPATRRLAASCLRNLELRGANLANPESVKVVLSKQSEKETAFKNKVWSSSRKRNMINAYTQFLKFCGLSWEAPRNKVTRDKKPFIPTDAEINDLIAGTPKAVSTILQLMKETAMRSGEAIRTEWRDVDFERKVIMCNHPEKGSNSRVFGKCSEKLFTMLSQMPKINDSVFGESTQNSLKATFGRSRKRLAFKLGNPRLLEIHFHTMRHYAATMYYHDTKDIMETKKFLGHKEIDNTQLYIDLDAQLFINERNDKFITRVAHTTEECCSLIDVGFEYVTGSFDDGGKIFRKRK